MKQVIMCLLLMSISRVELQGQENSVNWQSSEIIIDGSIADWSDQLRYYSKDTGVSYEFRNDSTNLYIAFELLDEISQMKALNDGFTVTFKVKTQPKTKAIIKLPTLTGQKSDMGPAKFQDVLNQKNTYLLGNIPAEIEGFRYSSGRVYPKKISENKLAYSYNWSASYILVYEIRIPIKELFGKDYNLSKLTGYDINIETRLLAIQRPSMSSGGQQMGDRGGKGGMGAGGSMGRGGSGGRGMGMSPAGGRLGGNSEGNPNGMTQAGNMQERMALFQDQSFRQKVKISSQTK